MAEPTPLAPEQRIITLDCDMLVQKCVLIDCSCPRARDLEADRSRVGPRNMDDLFTLPLPGRDGVAGTHACTCNPRKLSHYPKDWCGTSRARPLVIAQHPD